MSDSLIQFQKEQTPGKAVTAKAMLEAGIPVGRTQCAMPNNFTFADYIALVKQTEAHPRIFASQLVSPAPGRPETVQRDAAFNVWELAALSADVATYNVPLIRLQHGVEGLVTEAGELLHAWSRKRHDKLPIDKANVKEELGDAFWYLAILVDVIGPIYEPKVATLAGLVGAHFRTSVPGKMKKGFLIDQFVVDTTDLLDLLKKRKFYPRDIDADKFYATFMRVVEDLRYLCDAFKLDPFEVMASNIRKLNEVRYKNGFSTLEANARDTAAEMVAVCDSDGAAKIVADTMTQAIVSEMVASDYHPQRMVWENGEIHKPLTGRGGAVLSAADYSALYPTHVWKDGVGFVTPFAANLEVAESYDETPALETVDADVRGCKE